MNDTTEGSHAKQVVCPASKDLIIRPLILAVALIAFGVWCAFDQQDYVPFAEDMNGWFSYAMNFYGQFFFTALGLIPLYFTIRAFRRRLVADEEGVGYIGKEKVPWSSVTGLDAGELKAKQILYLLHGQDERFALDGFNLQNFSELVTFVERHVPPPDEAEPAAGDDADQASQDADQKPLDA